MSSTPFSTGYTKGHQIVVSISSFNDLKGHQIIETIELFIWSSTVLDLQVRAMDCEYTERSCEEEAELKRSTKKVKENTPPPHPGGSSSYREKLIGGMPGAFIQAFNLDSTLEEDPESDSEVDEITEGVAVVKLSKESKLRIRSKWAHTLIIKVFGRTVGFHFLHAKVMSLWKPFGRLEFVDLGKDFFLIRFGLVEDFNKVLRGGPWFIGEHYLTIRPWVPNFIPSEANCSSVAVWIRLPKLPLEYYEESVLKDIGKAIGPVLRIDTQTASEARGRYAVGATEAFDTT